MIWRLAVLCAALTALGAAAKKDACEKDAAKKDAAASSLCRGIEFLLSQQGSDGGWHSTTYGAMKQGAAVSSLALYAFSHVPAADIAPHRASLRRGYEFLQVGIEKKGYVANTDGSADFPTYASSMLLVAAKRLELPMTLAQRNRLMQFVADAQLSESRQFGPDSIHHGGWDLMGAQRILGQTSGSNVSISRFAVEALACCDSDGSQDTLLRARRWSAGLQHLEGDGGFFFTPDVDSENNKALADGQETIERERNRKHKKDPRPRAYGTCTCDGLLLLLASGLTLDDRPVAAAVQWLVRHPGVETVPGFSRDAQATGWQLGLRYYYYAAMAKTLPYLPPQDAAKRRTALIQLLVDAQRPDGSWQNSSARMREDDPLICSSLAITALATLLGQQDEQ